MSRWHKIASTLGHPANPQLLSLPLLGRRTKISTPVSTNRKATASSLANELTSSHTLATLALSRFQEHPCVSVCHRPVECRLKAYHPLLLVIYGLPLNWWLHLFSILFSIRKGRTPLPLHTSCIPSEGESIMLPWGELLHSAHCLWLINTESQNFLQRIKSTKHIECSACKDIYKDEGTCKFLVSF